MKILKTIIFLSLIFRSIAALSLEVDEKLTCKILKSSATKKTVLLNRGLEDGLVVGDHAKLFVTTGVIARAVMVKASPTRSIWSVYRIVDGQKIFNGNVVNLKISAAIKITDDKSKARPGEDAVLVSSEMMGEVQSRKDLSQSEKDDIASLGKTSSQLNVIEGTSGIAGDDRFEFWGLVHLNGLSVSSDVGDGNSVAGEAALFDSSVGMEKYFPLDSGVLKNVSLVALYHYSSNTASTIDGIKLSGVLHAGGVGVNWHLGASPLSYGNLIWFAGGAGGAGSVSEKLEGADGSNRNNMGFEGRLTFFSTGGGVKYYTREGIGVRALADFYQRSEKYIIEDGTNYIRTVSGLRAMVGLSYRF